MNNSIIKMLALVFTIMIAESGFGQTIQDEIKKLNEVSTHSLYNSSFTIDKDGLIKRTINSKKSDFQYFSFYIKDIKSIEYASDGFHNVLIKFKSGTKSIGLKKDNTQTESELNVIAFSNQTNCNKAIDIFKTIVLLSQQNE